MFTKTDAENVVITSIEVGDATREEFDIDAIIDAIYAENGGTYDFSDFDSDRFWEIVEANAR